MAEDLSRGEIQGGATATDTATQTGSTDSHAPAAAQGGAQQSQIATTDHQAANAATQQGNQPHGGPAQGAAASGQGHDGHVADAGTGQPHATAAADHQPGFEVAPGAIGPGAPGGQPGGEVAVLRPQAGDTMIYDVTPGEHLAIRFDPDTAIFRVAGNDFVLNFGDGGRIVLADFVDAAQSGHPPVLDIGGQQIVADALLNQALAFNEGLQFPETAAGGVVDGGGHNYSDDFGNLVGLLNPLGPIGPVAMNFGLIQLKPGGSPEGSGGGHPSITVTTETPAPPVTPPDHNPPIGNEPLIVYHGAGFEDAEPNQHIGDTSVHPTQIVIDFHPDGDQVLQTVVISGIPSGATVFCGGTDAGHIIDASSGSVTLTAEQVDTGVFMIPPHDSDADIPLHVVGNYISPNGDPQVSADTVFVVDAAADMPTNVSGTADHAVVQEGHPVTIAVQATFGDYTDGSETHYVMVELPSGWTNPQGYAIETVTQPNAFNVPAGNYVLVPVDNGVIAAGGGTVTVDVTLGTPATLGGSGAAQTVTLLSADAASGDSHGALAATAAHTFSLLAAPAADPSVSQTFHLTVIGKSVETTLSGAELTTDNNVSYGPAPVEHVDITVLHPGGDITVTTETNTPPVVPTPDVPGGSTGDGPPPTHEPNGTVTFHGGGFEDAEPNQHVGDTSLHPIHVIPTFTGLTDETLTSLTITGIPNGTTMLVGGQDLAHAVTVTNGALTLTPDQVASGIYMIPPADTDADIPLQVTGQFVEPQTGATGTVSGTTTAIVDAVADKPTNVSGTVDHSAVTEGHEVTFAVHATFGDHVDGSESHFVLVELESGWTNTAGYATETIAAGNAFGVPAGTYVVVPVDNATIGADGTVTANVTLTSPGHITGDIQTYDFEVVGKAQETTLSGAELTTDNNVSYTPGSTPVEVKVIHPGAHIIVTTETNTPPIVPTGDVPGGSTGDGTPPAHEPNGTVTFHGGGFEDAEPNQHVGDTSLHPIHVIPTFTGLTDETLTSLTITGIPNGTTMLVGGQDLAHAVTVTNGALTLTPDQVASGIYLIPPADTDADIPLQVTGQFVEPQTGATGTVSGTTTAIVDAVADKPTDVSGTPDHSVVQEGHPVTVTVHATFGDFTDGSESHSVLVQLDNGWTNTEGYATETIAAGNAFGVPAGTYVIVPVDNATIGADGSVSVDVTLGTPGDIKGSETFDLGVVGKAHETTLSGAELTTDNNVSYTPSSTPVEVKVSQPPVANPGHDGLYEAGLPDGTDSASGHDHAAGYLSVDFNGSTMAGTVTGFIQASGATNVSITENATSYMIDGGYFVMTVDKATGDYAATLLDNTLLHNGVNLGNDQDALPYTFTYTVTNADGLSASSTFTLNIADDRPEAYNDSNWVQKGETVAGNVMDNDQQGADHATVTQINGHAVDSTGDTTIAGTYGTLTIHADGSYSYTADHVNQGGTVVDRFTYQLTDGEGAHGDHAAANLDITIENALPLGAEDHATVAEDGIDGNAPFHAGSDAASGSESVSGTLHYDFGADHAAAANGGFAWSGAVTASDSDANGAFKGLTSGGDAVQFRVGNDGHTIVGYVPDTATGPYAGHDVLTLTVDPATGQYTYDQLGPIDHPDSAAAVGGNGETGAQDAINLQFGYTVTDSDGDTAQGHLTVAVQDDGPTAQNDSFGVHEATAAMPADSTVTGNVLANDQFGADGKGDITTVTVNGVNYHADGSADTVADHPGGHLVSNDHGVLVVQTDQGGTLTFHFDTGDFSYQAPDHMTSTTQSESFAYTIRDADGDLSRADLDINIQHQGPVAEDDHAQVATSDDHVGKLVYVIDTSESMGHALGAGTKLAAAKQAFETLNQQAIAAGFGGSEVLIVAFNNGIQSVHQFDHATDAAAIGTYIDSLSANGGTSYEPALSVVSDWLSGTTLNSHIAGADTTTTAVRHGSGFDDRVFFLTDGGNNDSAGGFDPSHGSLDNLYSNVGSLATDLHNVTVKSVGFGLDHNSPFYADLDRTDDNIQNGSAQTIDTQDGASGIVGGFGEVHTSQVVTGNVLQNDGIGHDGPAHIVSVTADGQTFTADSAVGGEVVSNSHGVITIHTQLGGEFQFNFNTGDYAYHAPDAALTSPVDEVFKYTVADALGATASANLTIEIDPSGNANGDFHLGNLLDWDHAGSAWVGQDSHGNETGMLSTNNDGPNTTHYSASDIAHFIGVDASDLSNLISQDVGHGSVMKTTLSVDPHSGNDISFDYNFLTGEGTAGSGNDFAFAEVNGKLYMLSDAHNDSGTLAPTTNTPHEGFDHSTGWHTATVHLDQSASQSGHVSVAFGVMNAGMHGVLGHDSGLEIDNVHAAAAHAAA